MDYDYIFSIVLLIDDFTAYSLKTLDSIINSQSLNFKEDIQLIVISSEKTTNSKLLDYLQRYPENIILINDDFSDNIIYEKILDYTNGKYISFLQNNIILSGNALTEINNLLEHDNLDVVFLLNKEFLDKKYPNDNEILFNLNEKNNLIPLKNSIYFVNRIVFESVITQYGSSDLWSIIIKVTDVNNTYAVLNESYYLIQYLNLNNIYDLKDNTFHYEKLNNFYLDLIDYSIQKYSMIPQFIKEIFIYQLADLIEEFDVNLLDKSEKSSFFELLDKIVSQLDFDAILYYRYINSRKKNFLLYLHNKCNILLENDENKLDLKIKNHLIDNLNRHKIWLDLVDINDNVLRVSGLLQSNFSNEDITIKLVSKRCSKKSVFDCTLYDYTQDERKNISYLSIDWVYRYNFDFEISIDELLGSQSYFEVIFDNGDEFFSYLPEIAFRIPASLSTSSIYQTNDNYMLYFKDNSLNIIENNYPMLLKLELSNLKKIFKDKRRGYSTAIFLRIIYLLIYPIMHKKDIWLFNDRLSLADDNAICLYDYAVNQNDDVNKYFVISADSKGYKELKSKYSNIIKFGSFKHKLLYLFAKKIVYSFVNEDYSNPYHVKDNLDYKQMYSGLFSFKKYFLQHGVTLGDYSNSIKKYNMNLSLIDTSSIIEADSYRNSSYGFNDEVIQTLGLPRYDKLDKFHTKKQIVYMPTWRSYLNFDNSLFEYSKFYKTLSDLLNNQKLHGLLDDYGYEFIFKPHPELNKYLDYFSLDNVHLSEESYRNLFNESALLLTDYSSVAFDFAYLKKPVVYYQNSDDYHYKKGYFDFDTMGFGKVVSDENELIEIIEEYLKNECKMEEEYQKRVDQFFNYHDHDNCRRVYFWIKNN